jgi:hypothetical protein
LAMATTLPPDAAGNRLMVLEEYQQAVAAYTRALEGVGGLGDADRARVLTCRSAAHLELGAPAAAQADAHAAAALDPDSYLAPFREGTAAWRREEFAAAVTALKAALRNAGEPGSARFDECAKLLNQSQAQLSLRNLQRAEAARASSQRDQVQFAAMAAAGASGAAPQPVRVQQPQQPQQPPQQQQQKPPQQPSAAAVAAAAVKKQVNYPHSHYQTDKWLYIEVQTGPVAASEVQHRFGADEIWLRVERLAAATTCVGVVVAAV